MENKQQLEIVKAQSSKATFAANLLEIETQEDLQKAAELLTKIKTVQKIVKTEKDKVLKPLLEATKAERARWEPIEEDTENAERTVKTKMSVYQMEAERKAREEEAKIQKQLEEGKIKKAETAIKKIDQIEQPKANISTKTGAVQFRKIQKCRITNIDIIPDEYWEVNESRVRQAVLAGNEVPGAESYEELVPAGLSY